MKTAIILLALAALANGLPLNQLESEVELQTEGPLTSEDEEDPSTYKVLGIDSFAHYDEDNHSSGSLDPIEEYTPSGSYPDSEFASSTANPSGEYTSTTSYPVTIVEDLISTSYYYKLGEEIEDQELNGNNNQGSISENSHANNQTMNVVSEGDIEDRIASEIITEEQEVTSHSSEIANGDGQTNPHVFSSTEQIVEHLIEEENITEENNSFSNVEGSGNIETDQGEATTKTILAEESLNNHNEGEDENVSITESGAENVSEGEPVGTKDEVSESEIIVSTSESTEPAGTNDEVITESKSEIETVNTQDSNELSFSTSEATKEETTQDEASNQESEVEETTVGLQTENEETTQSEIVETKASSQIEEETSGVTGEPEKEETTQSEIVETKSSSQFEEEISGVTGEPEKEETTQSEIVETKASSQFEEENSAVTEEPELEETTQSEPIVDVTVSSQEPKMDISTDAQGENIVEESSQQPEEETTENEATTTEVLITKDVDTKNNEPAEEEQTIFTNIEVVTEDSSSVTEVETEGTNNVDEESAVEVKTSSEIPEDVETTTQEIIETSVVYEPTETSSQSVEVDPIEEVDHSSGHSSLDDQISEITSKDPHNIFVNNDIFHFTTEGSPIVSTDTSAVTVVDNDQPTNDLENNLEEESNQTPDQDDLQEVPKTVGRVVEGENFNFPQVLNTRAHSTTTPAPVDPNNGFGHFFYKFPGVQTPNGSTVYPRFAVYPAWPPSRFLDIPSSNKVNFAHQHPLNFAQNSFFNNFLLQSRQNFDQVQ